MPGPAAVAAQVRAVLPNGWPLPDEVWDQRHRALVILVATHAVALGLAGGLGPEPAVHGLAEAALLGAAATAACLRRLGRTVRSLIAALGLMGASSLVVHISGGYIEAHFHFFVVVGLLALYQDWRPFLAALGFVVVHHGAVGAIAPESVFNHPSAIAHPWRWAAVHGGYILAAAMVHLVAWGLSERFHSELRAAERQARASEARFRTLAQHGSDLVVTVAGDDAITYASDSLAGTLGWRPEEVVGRSAFELIHPGDWELAKSLTGDEQQPGEHRTADLRLRHGNGSWRLMRTVCTNFLHDPSVQAIVVNAHDVTDRVAAEEALRQSEERFRALVQHASDIIAIVEADGRLRYASPAAERVLGYAPPTGENVFAAFVHPDDAGPLGDAFAGLLSNPGVTMPSDLRLRHADGSWRHVEVVANNLLEDPVVRGVVVTVRDVTEKRAADQQLRDTERRLYEAHLRQRQALEINDNVVQGLAVAKYALDAGNQPLAAQSIDQTLAAARAIISGLLEQSGGALELRPGDLVRAEPASVLENGTA